MTTCLLALSSLNILGAGVERLLSSVDDLELVSLPVQDRSGLVEGIQKAHADVVIVDGELLLDEAFLVSLLPTRPGLLVIQIDPQDNQLQIYQHQRLSIRETSELIALIQSQ